MLQGKERRKEKQLEQKRIKLAVQSKDAEDEDSIIDDKAPTGLFLLFIIINFRPGQKELMMLLLMSSYVDWSNLDETAYVLKDGWRTVLPYYSEFRAFAKRNIIFAITTKFYYKYMRQHLRLQNRVTTT